MNNPIVAPSKMVEYETIPSFMTICKDGIIKGRETDYLWYNYYGIYYAHRRPTISEMLKDEFN